jgi:hypothetical protein
MVGMVFVDVGLVRPVDWGGVRLGLQLFGWSWRGCCAEVLGLVHSWDRQVLRTRWLRGLRSHDLALLVIDDFLTSMGIPHTNEPQLFPTSGLQHETRQGLLPPGQPKVVDMTHSQTGKTDNSSATLKAADALKNNKYAALSTEMGYSFIPLSATPYGAVGKPFEDC